MKNDITVEVEKFGVTILYNDELGAEHYLTLPCEAGLLRRLARQLIVATEMVSVNANPVEP